MTKTSWLPSPYASQCTKVRFRNTQPCHTVLSLSHLSSLTGSWLCTTWRPSLQALCWSWNDRALSKFASGSSGLHPDMYSLLFYNHAFWFSLTSRVLLCHKDLQYLNRWLAIFSNPTQCVNCTILYIVWKKRCRILISDATSSPLSQMSHSSLTRVAPPPLAMFPYYISSKTHHVTKNTPMERVNLGWAWMNLGMVSKCRWSCVKFSKCTSGWNLRNHSASRSFYVHFQTMPRFTRRFWQNHLHGEITWMNSVSDTQTHIGR